MTMQDLAGFRCFEVQFTRDGQVFDPHEVDDLLSFFDQATTTDLFVIAHGWNNDMAAARQLYANFFGRVRAMFDAGHVPGLETRSFAVLAVLWPSKKFAAEDLIPSGAAAV